MPPPKRRPSRLKKRKKKLFVARKPVVSRFLWRLCILAFLWGGVGVGLYVGYCAVGLPDIHEVTQPPLRPSVTIEAEDGTVFARYGDLSGEHVVLAELPPYVPQAILAIEDRRFYSHPGIDVFGVMRAAFRNLVAGRTVQGGSTLTQQLAKNLFLTPDRTMRRKVQEMLLAFWLEHAYTKDQILTAYLNRVYLGSGAYGVDAASRTYFDKPAKDMNVREAALVAGLLRAPSRFSPMRDPAQAMERARIVLQAMLEENYITEVQHKAALAGTQKTERRIENTNIGRYFADWIYDQIGPMVNETAQDMVVKTTLSLSLQKTAERHVEDILAKNGEAKKVSEAALVSVAPDGAVKALTGGRNYGQSQFNRATQAMRQPGSSFKPIVYLTGIERGLSPDEIVMDEPIKIGKYAPHNYDGKYLGPISVRHALAESINSVAVRLLDRYGVGNVIQTAESLGIASPLERDAALALGASVLTPLELTAVYASLASGGKAIMPYAIKEIRSRSNQVLYRHNDVSPPQVVDAGAVAVLTNMMEDVIRWGTGKGASLGSRPAAGKTGTTSDYRDAWFAGFTADYTTVVWMGNDDNSSMKKVTGGSLPAMLWRAYMADAERNFPEVALNDGHGTMHQFMEKAGGVADDVSQAFGDILKNVTGNR